MALSSFGARGEGTYGCDSAGRRDCAHGPAGLSEGVSEHGDGSLWDQGRDEESIARAIEGEEISGWGGEMGSRRDSGREKMEISQEREKSLGNGASGFGARDVSMHVITTSPDTA